MRPQTEQMNWTVLTPPESIHVNVTQKCMKHRQVKSESRPGARQTGCLTVAIETIWQLLPDSVNWQSNRLMWENHPIESFNIMYTHNIYHAQNSVDLCHGLISLSVRASAPCPWATDSWLWTMTDFVHNKGSRLPLLCRSVDKEHCLYWVLQHERSHTQANSPEEMMITPFQTLLASLMSAESSQAGQPTSTLPLQHFDCQDPVHC